MSKWKLERWCLHATARIRYGPDRKAAYTELREHIDDRYEHFRGKGNPDDAAVEQTLSAMGDAEEVSAMLEKTCTPFWGYLYTFAKWAVILLSVLCLYQLIARVWDHRYLYHEPQTPYFSQDYTGADQMILYDRPETSVTCDGYTVTLTQVAQWRSTMGPKENVREDLFIELEVTSPNPWVSPGDILDWIHAVDSNGNYYCSKAEYLFILDSPSRSFYAGLTRTGPFTNVYEIQLTRVNPEDTAWFDFGYNRDGRDWTIRVDLTGGTAP